MAQCWGSVWVSTQAGPSGVEQPIGVSVLQLTSQPPPLHTADPLAAPEIGLGQALSQSPQCSGLLSTSTHCPLHAV